MGYGFRNTLWYKNFETASFKKMYYALTFMLRKPFEVLQNIQSHNLNTFNPKYILFNLF